MVYPTITRQLYLCGVCALALFGMASSADASTVENYVSVQADSGTTGQSMISTQTIINGRVVEAVTKHGTGTIEYHSTLHTNSPAVAHVSSTVATSTTAQRALLQALIHQLYQYVLLLTQRLEQAGQQ